MPVKGIVMKSSQVLSARSKEGFQKSFKNWKKYVTSELNSGEEYFEGDMINKYMRFFVTCLGTLLRPPPEGAYVCLNEAKQRSDFNKIILKKIVNCFFLKFHLNSKDNFEYFQRTRMKVEVFCLFQLFERSKKNLSDIQQRALEGAKRPIVLLKDRKIESFVTFTPDLIPKSPRTHHFLNAASQVYF